jgi:hypothetical protein
MKLFLFKFEEDCGMRVFLKYFIVSAAVVLLVSVYSAGTKATGTAESSAKYIEVCNRGTVYVPPGTEYVTCHGKVMKVIAIVPFVDGAQTLGGGGCFCPKCCGGACVVTVACENKVGDSTEEESYRWGQRSSSAGGLCTLYLACGD